MVEQVSPSVGVVVLWDDVAGWGVLESDDVPGPVWAHFSHVVESGLRGFRRLHRDEPVVFTWRPADRVGYLHRAVRVAWTAEADPEALLFGPEPTTLPGGAYASRLTTWPDGDADGR